MVSKRIGNGSLKCGGRIMNVDISSQPRAFLGATLTPTAIRRLLRYRAHHRSLEATERKVKAVFRVIVVALTWKLVCACIASLRGAFDRGSTGIGQAQQPSDLVESFSSRVVQSGASFTITAVILH